MGFFNKLFGKKVKVEEPSEEQLYEFSINKQKALEDVLGNTYELVGHAIIPFQIGGTVDMYYFPNSPIEGTAFATLELIEYENRGPIPNRNGMYELAAFTKLKINKKLNEAAEIPENIAFEKIERKICGIFTSIGNYSYEAKLEPGETCEIPGKEGEENVCLVFDEYKNANAELIINGKKYGLLLCIEIFRSEMEYAMEHGSKELFRLLKDNGHYPYSDLDRLPVI